MTEQASKLVPPLADDWRRLAKWIRSTEDAEGVPTDEHPRPQWVQRILAWCEGQQSDDPQPPALSPAARDVMGHVRAEIQRLVDDGKLPLGTAYELAARIEERLQRLQQQQGR